MTDYKDADTKALQAFLLSGYARSYVEQVRFIWSRVPPQNRVATIGRLKLVIDVQTRYQKRLLLKLAAVGFPEARAFMDEWKRSHPKALQTRTRR